MLYIKHTVLKSLTCFCSNYLKIIFKIKEMDLKTSHPYDMDKKYSLEEASK